MNKTQIGMITATALSLVIAAAACTKNSDESANTSTASNAANTMSSQNSMAQQNTANAPAAAPTYSDVKELKIEDLKAGTGAEATPGKMVTVNYTGWLTNGTKFDSSLDRNQPFQFKLGGGMVIKGWDQGVAGMKVGGKRRLIIPSQLGYGERGAGNVIPPNATLVFEVDLLDVK
jgi:FKBP-type peptidyl-prolyl cis-trans isomerase FkpA